jgi:Tol biopolymer transport system component
VATGLALVRFVDNGGPASEVFVVDAEGEFHQLTGLGSAPSLGASRPVWSPDGRQLAFGPPKVGAGPNRFLSVILADGSGERPLAPLGDEFGLPFGWSPDGASLLFFDIDAVTGPAMWLTDVASGEVRLLGAGQLPRWLSDGRRISFQRGVEGRDPADPQALTEVIYVMSLDGGEAAEFARASDAIWSPDGSAVLLEHATGDLLLADADGSNPRDLVRGWAPVWSPDGSRIVFAYDHNHDGVPLLAAVDRDGHALWSGVAGSSPTWSPDGSRMAVEVLFPALAVKVLDARTGDVLWQTAGAEPAWGP